MAKNNTMLYLVVIILAILFLGGSFSIPKFDFGNFLGGGVSADLVDVNKPVEIALINEYAGQALTSKTLDIYDSDGETPLETGLSTGSDGTATSALPYKSGKVIYIRYESSNDKMWWQKTVPQMTKADAESATVNAMEVRAFAIGTYTNDGLFFGATSYTDDTGEYNKTASGNTPTFTYRLANTGNDNTGLKTSYDPVYKQNWNVVIYMTLSGTNYETILVYGFDYDWTSGTTHYTASNLDAYALTKHKVGNTYKSNGVLEFQFTLDLTGYSGDAVTLQIRVEAYADATWAQTHGNDFGVESYEIAEHTILLKD